MKCIHLQQRKCTSSDAFSFGTVPHPRVCASCKHYEGPDRGVGDTVHRALQSTGFTTIFHKIVGKDCGGCSKRRVWLNGKLAYDSGPVGDEKATEGDKKALEGVTEGVTKGDNGSKPL